MRPVRGGLDNGESMAEGLRDQGNLTSLTAIKDAIKFSQE
jgi:hypothetical protein